MFTRIHSGAVDGIDGIIVTVEVDVSRGLPGFHIVGLPNAAVRESRERVLAAIRNCGFSFPLGKVTVNLAPADIRKEGASFDLAIAMGVIATRDGTLAGDAGGRRRVLLLGELSLFGELRCVRGLLGIILAASALGERTVVVPAAQAWEARLVDGMEVIGVETLTEVVSWWRQGTRPSCSNPTPGPSVSSGKGVPAETATAAAAFLGLVGQPEAQRAAYIAAAGRHNLLLVGPPGTGKTRLARAIESLQPPLSAPEALEVTRIHSAAGTLRGSRLLRTRPFRAPHHTITRAGLIGGGGNVRPGEATLAHRGILFLDEVAEFAPAVLDVLREPLEEGRIAVARNSVCRIFPASFQLVAAMNPCRCGYLGSRRRSCQCAPAAVVQYRGRLSGPLLDRIDLFVEMREQTDSFLEPGNGETEAQWQAASDSGLSSGSSARWRTLQRDVARARRELRAWTDPDHQRSLDPRRAVWEMGLDASAAAYLEEARQRLTLSIRGVLRCARVARTIATLGGKRRVTASHVAEALGYRLEAIPGFMAGAELT